MQKIGNESNRDTQTGARLSGRMADEEELTALWQGKQLIGKGRRSAELSISIVGVCDVKVHFFPIFTLSPPVMFEHLSGRGLAAFLDKGLLKPPDGEGQNVRYVHGRSEVMRGNHRVSSVLLAEVPEQDAFSETAWMINLPKIYKKFLQVYNPV